MSIYHCLLIADKVKTNTKKFILTFKMPSNSWAPYILYIYLQHMVFDAKKACKPDDFHIFFLVVKRILWRAVPSNIPTAFDSSVMIWRYQHKRERRLPGVKAQSRCQKFLLSFQEKISRSIIVGLSHNITRVNKPRTDITMLAGAYQNWLLFTSWQVLGIYRNNDIINFLPSGLRIAGLVGRSFAIKNF